MIEFFIEKFTRFTELVYYGSASFLYSPVRNIKHPNTAMLNLFKSSKVSSMQKKYDRLMKEAYELSKSNPEESLKKQKEAQEIQRQIIAMPL